MPKPLPTDNGASDRDPMVVAWPARITSDGSLRTQFTLQGFVKVGVTVCD